MNRDAARLWYWILFAGSLVGGIAAGTTSGFANGSFGYPFQGLSTGLCVVAAAFAVLADRAGRGGSSGSS